MTTDAQDLSNFDGVPITLYTFVRSTTPTVSGTPVTTYYRYTSADRDVVVGADTYTAITISDEGIKQSGDEVSDQLTVTMPAGLPVPLLFLAAPPEDPVGLIIRRVHDGETDPFIVWAGTIGAVRRVDEITSSLVCNTATASLSRGGLRMLWSRGCPHALYDGQCQADPLDFVTTGTITAVGGGTVTVPEFDALGDGWFDGGWVEKVDGDGHALRRAIISHTGSVVSVLTTTYGLEIGDEVAGFAGCDRAASTCDDKFDNLSNFGGHSYLPGKSPFDGEIVF